MASSMRRVSKEDLIEMINSSFKDHETVGLVVTVGDTDKPETQHEVIMMFKPMERI